MGMLRPAVKTARQLKDLIRNLSKKNAADAQILMRNYMMERFLERISLSSYRDKFILKGGMLVAAMVGPLGLPMAAAWLVGKVQDLRYAIQDAVYG